mgnify:CR=1 FL=1
MYAVYILMIRTARKAVPISEHTLYNYIRKLREVLSKDKEISITTVSYTHLTLPTKLEV